MLIRLEGSNVTDTLKNEKKKHLMKMDLNHFTGFQQFSLHFCYFNFKLISN